MAAIDYAHLAEDYARNRRVHPAVLRQLIDAVGGPEAQIVEVGSGTGNYITALHEATGCRAIGIEPAPAMLEQARTRAMQVTWIQAPGEVLPLADGSVDMLFTVDVAHHLRDRPAFFAEVRRVLKRGGVLCTVTDSAEDISSRRPLASHFPETVAADLARYPGIPALREESRAAGLVDRGITHAVATYALTDVAPYRARAYSCLHLIPEGAWRSGLQRLEAEFAAGGVEGCSRYTLIWAGRA